VPRRTHTPVLRYYLHDALFSIKVHIITYPGFAWLIRRVLDWMIGFIGTSFTISRNYNNSQSVFSRTLLPWLPRIRPVLVPLLSLLSQSQSYLTTGGLPPVSWSGRQAPWDSRSVILVFQLNTCGYSPYITSSLTRAWVCCLQLLLALASAVFLRSVSRGTHDHSLLSQIRDSPNLEGLSFDSVLYHLYSLEADL
jgi:hypothetical protein